MYDVGKFGLYIVHEESTHKCILVCICICIMQVCECMYIYKCIIHVLKCMFSSICICIMQVWSVRCWSDPLIHCHALFLARSLNTDSLHRVNTRKTTTSSPRFQILPLDFLRYFLVSGHLEILLTQNPVNVFIDQGIFRGYLLLATQSKPQSFKSSSSPSSPSS